MKITFHKYEIIDNKDLTANQVQGSYGWSKDEYSGTLYAINTVVEANETISVAIVIQDDGSIHQIPISEITVLYNGNINLEPS